MSQENLSVDAKILQTLREQQMTGLRLQAPQGSEEGRAAATREVQKREDRAAEKAEILEAAPVVPDPFWPEGAVPTHLPANARDDAVVDAAWELVGADGKWRCAECGSPTNRSIKNPQLCGTCWQKSVERTELMKRTNEGWMEQAEQLGLALYERQPEETDNEWIVWEKYRSYYPLKMPTWAALARELGVSASFVIKTSQRWNFKSRMIQWAKAVDGDGQEKRIKEIRALNQKQMDMAKRLTEKVSQAIDMVDPALLRPGEIVNLAKFATELERRTTEYIEEKVESTAVETQSTNKIRTKAEDLSEVMSILQQTGVITPGGPKVVGVEHKTTVLVKEGE